MEKSLGEVIVNGVVVKYEAITVEKNSPEGAELSRSGYYVATEYSNLTAGKFFWTYIKIIY